MISFYSIKRKKNMTKKISNQINKILQKISELDMMIPGSLSKQYKRFAFSKI